MRCLTLADALAEAGGQIEFVCRAKAGNLIQYIERDRGFPVHVLPKQYSAQEDAQLTAKFARSGERPDWVVVDHYGLNETWERQQRPFCERVMAIDDIADRRHDCDLLLDQNLNEFGGRYDELVPSDCVKLLGPDYALLRPEFATIRDGLRERTAKVERLLVNFGGTDPTGETITSLTQLRGAPSAQNLQIDLVVGSNQASLAEVVKLAESMTNVKVYVQTPKMAQLMAGADIGIGAGGSTIWERCCLGLPTITVAVADHQVPYCQRLSDLGYISYAGSALEGPLDYVAALQGFLQEPDERCKMSRLGMDLVDGRGASRVVECMLR